ncbi:MAG: serine dehydratase subunit alpha family protein [Firmicutes bacterium]|nr:serine dehydratase subunit alpha family protein [Bacillota bacterium]
MFTLKEFLEKEVKPALGCTEPGAVALAVARACQEIEAKEEIDYIEVEVSDSVYKNGMDVGIPGTDGARGNAIAAVLGLICGKASYGLEVLRDCQKEDVVEAKKWIKDKRVSIICHPKKSGVYIHAAVFVKKQATICIIEGDHSNITMVSKNGKTIFEKKDFPNTKDKKESIQDMIGKLSYREVLSLVDNIDKDDVAYIMNGVKMNLKMAEYGLRDDTAAGAGFGKALKKIMKENKLEEELGYLIKSYSFAASDARMGGAFLPVMSSAGSGNHGITAIIPLAIVGRKKGRTDEEIASAIAISHLTTSYVKSKIGRLSPVCGCAVAAGSGAAAGLTYILEGNYEQAVLAVKTLLANTAGMVCDGAKESCALKVGTAAFEAYLSALFALDDKGIDSAQGVIDASIEVTVNNMGRVNCIGMKNMDSVIIDIMEERAETARKKYEEDRLSIGG